MRIIFMGTPDFAVATLDALVQAGHEVVLAVTQPDKPRGRHGELQKSDVRLRAEEYGIPVITPTKIRTDEEAKEKLRALTPELIVVTAFGQILPKDVLDIPKYGCINVHASLLPKYRGASPIQWQILNGDQEVGVTTMQMDVGLDSGDILEQAVMTPDPKETGGSLFEKLAVLGGELIVKTIQKLEAGTLTRTPQEEEKATKVGMFTKHSGRIHWQDSAEKIERMIRGLNPWPSAYTYLKGKQLKLWEATVLSEEILRKEGVVSVAELEDEGQAFSDGKALYLQTGQGVLRVDSLQLEGKKRMKTEDFLRGYKF